MAVFRLVEVFEGRTELPIDLDEVTSWIIQNRIQQEINFIPVNLDTGVIRGFLKRYKRSNGGWHLEPDLVSSVYYDQNQGADWINLVCAKELLHILDAATVTTKEQFDKLTQRLSLPDDIRHFNEDPDYALVDKFGSAPASALLLPIAAREALLPHYKAGTINAADIARLAVMPVQHVRTVMSDNWPRIYEVIRNS
jgi:hypothetical protein